MPSCSSCSSPFTCRQLDLPHRERMTLGSPRLQPQPRRTIGAERARRAGGVGAGEEVKQGRVHAQAQVSHARRCMSSHTRARRALTKALRRTWCLNNIQAAVEAYVLARPDVHGSRSEQPTQESPLRPVLHAVREYVIRAAAPETVGQTCPHDCAPARAHVAPRHHVLLVCALKQRLSGVRFSGLRYSRSCAWSSMRALTQARARMQYACSLTQSAHARYLRSWTRCRRSDIWSLTASTFLYYLSHSPAKHLSILHVTRSACS